MFPILIQPFISEIGRMVVQARYLWIPVGLFIILRELWIYYVRSRFIQNLEWTTLEIKLPREIVKSPRAMELVLNALHITSDGDFVKQYWEGFLRPWFSLEIAGINGEIHFFIHCQKFFTNLVEAQIYAHYPDVEIAEVVDYSKIIPIDGDKEWGCFGTEFKLTADDPYPIKTYIDYDLNDLATKEEQKTDPLNSFLELLGSLQKGEQIWLQILIRATKTFKWGGWSWKEFGFEKLDWKKQGEKLVEKLMKTKETNKNKENSGEGATMLSPGQRTVIEAVERDISKLGFDTGMRIMYLAKKDKFNAINIPSMIGVMKQYNAMNLNGFKPTSATSVDYFFKERRETVMKRQMLDAFRKRSYFYMPYARKPFVLNTEELATIFHFPGRVAETPTLARVEAKKSEPPADLPI